MKIAVVILNWNGKKLLEQFLPYIVKYSPEASIYVADNASTDDSVSFIKSNFPSVFIIQNKANFGFAKGYNEALENIEHDLYALVNSDIEVTENWLQPIIETFERERNTAIIQPKILDFKQKDCFEYAGAAGGFIDKYGYPFCRGRIFETVEKDNQQYDDNCEIFWASGACFFIRKSVYRDLLGFDPDFFAHQEEIDLCWRAHNKGYSVKYISKSVVYHIGGATLKFDNPKKTFLNFRNSLLMLTKNLPRNQLIQVLFSRLLLDGVAALHFLGQGKISHVVAILRAHLSFYVLFGSNHRKRNEFQSAYYYTTRSILYVYFLKNIRVFNNILGSK